MKIHRKNKVIFAFGAISILLIIGTPIAQFTLFALDPCGHDQFKETQKISSVREFIYIPKILRDTPRNDNAKYSSYRCGHYYSCQCTMYRKYISFDSSEETSAALSETIDYFLKKKNYQSSDNRNFCNTKKECVSVREDTDKNELIIQLDLSY